MPTRVSHLAFGWFWYAIVISCFVSLARGAVDFETEIKPIIEAACLSCHCEEIAEGDLRLDSLEAAMAKGEHGPAITPRDLEKSSFYTRIVLPADHEQSMPPGGPPLDESQIRRVRKWIEEGRELAQRREARSNAAHRLRGTRATDTRNELCFVSLRQRTRGRLRFERRLKRR